MMMSWMTLTFQDPNSINMILMVQLHYSYLMLFTFIMSLTLFMMIKITFNKMINKSLLESQLLENLWTVLPLMSIIMMMNLSIKCMYLNNEMKLNVMNIKIIGNQWFWSYEYLNFNKKINSYLMNKSNFNFNLIETDNHLIIPLNTQMILITSSLDVIHSWTIPSINMKMDCIPNQLNQTQIKINKPGMMFGQCSEVCGINHSFMPIQAEIIKMKYFIKWMN